MGVGNYTNIHVIDAQLHDNYDITTTATRQRREAGKEERRKCILNPDLHVWAGEGT